ncbi:transcription factor bHLH106-like [Durio zibethinus]|uniref:Transcription factor bHLH106-like n=1 Tax=Durio zibethinus TaxID=66656 RepID=A0A6P6B5Z5_DURZI|nr:transcription factor bHLH106-like [Durio zibethinus]
MFPVKSFCGFEDNSHVNLKGGDDSIKTLSERKSTEVCKSHKEAERRRRQRINAHLSTLRSLLPNTTKTDKASLLAEVVHHVRELNKQVEDVWRRDGDGDGDGDGFCSNSQPELDKSWLFPGECDEADLSFCDKEGMLLKVNVCCDDRPGLYGDLSRVIRSVQARVVRAEMTTVGGRTKSVVVMQWRGEEDDIGPLKRALKDVVENRVSGLVQGAGSKRVQYFGSDSESGHGFLAKSTPYVNAFGFCDLYLATLADIILLWVVIMLKVALAYKDALSLLSIKFLIKSIWKVFDMEDLALQDQASKRITGLVKEDACHWKNIWNLATIHLNLGSAQDALHKGV